MLINFMLIYFLVTRNFKEVSEARVGDLDAVIRPTTPVNITIMPSLGLGRILFVDSCEAAIPALLGHSFHYGCYRVPGEE